MRLRLRNLGMVCAALFLCVGLPARAQEFCDRSVPIAIQPPSGGGFVPGCTEYYFTYGAPTDTTAGFTALYSPGCAADQGDPTADTWVLINRVYVGYPCCVDSGWCIRTPSGDFSDPLCVGLRYRFEVDEDLREAVCFADYHGTGQRLMVVPVTTGRTLDGSSCCPLIRMARIFLTRHPATKRFRASFVGYLDWTPISTLVHPSTWGSLKAAYR